jgi:multidrug efflux system outer membrane protein
MTLQPSLRILTATAGASLLLASCAVGPKAPDATLPPSASGAFIGAASPAVSANTTARDDWWRLYNDPVLDGLVGEALANNNELEAAAANLRRVRAALGEARVGRFPSTTTSAGFTNSRASAATLPAGSLPAGQNAPDVDTYNAGLDVSYEIDLFGRVGSTVRAAHADAAAAEAALNVVRVTVAAETARAYADSCSSNAQIAVAERTIALQTDTVGLTQRLLDAGSGNGLDVARARSALESTRSTLPPLRAQRDGALFRLATLTGRTPGEASEAARACQAPPQLAQPIPVGDGAALLARRPDVRQAERNLAAAAARVNVATADLYPRITLGGSAGATSPDGGGLGDSENFRFSVGPLISWSFPNIVRRPRADRTGGRVLTDAALATFDQTVLGRCRKPRRPWPAYANELDRRAALTNRRATRPPTPPACRACASTPAPTAS